MKSFIAKSSVLIVFILGIHLSLVFLADGQTDPYYLKVASNKQQSLIIGASRAYEGIIPTYLNKTKSNAMYNFAFTNSDSPYGPVYLNAILKKVKNTKKGLFILSVHPWSISSIIDNKETKFMEENLVLGKISQYSGSPNFNYFLNGYNYGWGNILLRKFESKLSDKLFEHSIIKNGSDIYVHENGWLENTYFNTSEEAKLKRLNAKVKSFYIKDKKKYKYYISKARVEYLIKTIDELKKHGEVYLVKLPIDAKVLIEEKKYMPEFDSLINNIAKKNKVTYIEAPNNYNYKYADGNHLVKESAEVYSLFLANKIIKLE